MEKMQLEYHKAAEEKGVYAISSCGFDSIPADLGTVYLMNKFKGLSLTFIVWKWHIKAPATRAPVAKF
jgi:short subunit dehydrogenase-like uncharacterized protein